MPVFPGQLRYIRKNIFHAVYVLDPASISGLEASNLAFHSCSIFKINRSFILLKSYRVQHDYFYLIIISITFQYSVDC